MPRVSERVDTYSPTPAWSVLCGFGTAALTVALWNFASEIVAFGVAPGPLVAAATGISLASGVIYAGDQLRRSDAEPAEAWTVTLSSLAVGSFVGFGYGVTIFVREVEGRPVGEPAFPLVVMLSLGLLGGVVLGWERVRRRRVIASVRTARDGLAFANKLLGHDVRNAMQIIDWRAGELADHEAEAVSEHADVIRWQVESLDGLIGDVRSLTDVLTGEVDSEPVDLTRIVEDVLDATADAHPKLTLERDLPEQLRARGHDALSPVFRNLVDNAAKHADGEPVRVSVTGRRVDDRVRIRVADDGPGVPAAERERIFEQGVSTDGSGYGLYVVESIVEHLDGAVTVADSDLGGAAFVVELPAAERTR